MSRSSEASGASWASTVPSAVVHEHHVHPAFGAASAPIANVAVLVSLNFPDMTPETADLVTRFTRVALQTLTDLRVGYELFDTTTALADASSVAHSDGLLLLGGGDVCPTIYGGETDSAQNSYGVDVRADRDAIDAVTAAVAAEIPVLGICRGAQLVNVAYGGTLIPDIVDYALHRGGPGEPMFLDEHIDLVLGTRLQSILGAAHVIARSGHHQAVSELGAGLVLAARAQDGVIEGFEDPNRWVVGVQWHPEDDDGSEQDRQALFAGFVSACASGASRATRG